MLLPNMLVSNFGKLNILGVRVKCQQAMRPEIKKFNVRRQRWHLAIPSTTQSSGGESGAVKAGAGALPQMEDVGARVKI